MAYQCPHCSTAIDGVLTQEAHEGRLNAKGEEVRQLRDALSTSQAKATGFDSVAAERDQLRSELAGAREQGERFASMATIGITDQKAIQGFESIYASEVAGVAEAERPTFQTWLEAEEGARAHPLLSARFSAPAETGDAAPPPAGAPPAPPAYPAPNAGANGGAQPPTRDQGKMNGIQLRAYLASLSPTQAKAWKEQNGEAYGWGG